MPLDFPSSPTTNQTYTFGGKTWQYNGSAWDVVSQTTVGTTLIADDAVTYAKIQNVSATDKLLGRSSVGAGDIEEIPCTAAGRALLDDVDAAAQRTTLGLGTLATQSGTFSGTSSGTNTGDQTITLTGNVTGSGTGSFATTIANSAVTYAKIQNVSATDKLLGRSTAGAGVVEEIACTAAGRALLDDADAAAQRTTLGLGTLATQSGTFSGTSSGTNTGDQTITLTGDVTGTGTGSFATTLSTVNANVGSFTNANITVDGKGRITAASSGAASGVSSFTAGTTGFTPSTATTGAVTLAGTLNAANGGTGQSSYTSGDLLYATGTTALSKLGVGTAKQALVSSGTAPQWATIDLTYMPDAAFKKSVRCATTAAITLSGLQTIDGITVVAGDRVLVKDQGTPATNGIYDASATAWTRSVDADTASEIAGAIVNVDSGTANGGFLFDCDFKSTDTLGTTGLTFNRVLDASWTGSTSVTTLGTIGTGTWQGSVINSTYGGTGVNNGGRTLAVNTNSGTLAFTNASTTLTVANTGSVSGTNTGDQTITLTGDVTGTGTGSFATTLSTVNANVGSFTNANITVDAKGRITAASSGAGGGGTTTNALTFNNGGTGAASGSTFNGSAAVTVSYNTLGASPLAGSTSLTTLGTVGTGTWQGSVINSTYGGMGVNNGGRTLAVNTNSGSLTFTNPTTTLTVANTGSVSGTNTGDQTITLTGDVTGTGTGSFAATLASVGTAGTYTKVTTDAKGRVTSGTTLASADLPTYTGTLTSTQVTTALTYTPLNRAGDNLSGQVTWTGTAAAQAMDLATNDGWLSARVIRNNKATSADGLFIGYGNANSASTRIYGGGSTGAHSYIDVNGNFYRSDNVQYVLNSGTWGINVTGLAYGDSVLDRDRPLTATLPTTFPNSVRYDFVNAGATGTGGSYAGVMTFSPWLGTTASTGDASYQLAFGSTATNGGGTPQLRIRKGIDSTWNSWYDVLTTANYSSYALPISGGTLTGSVAVRSGTDGYIKLVGGGVSNSGYVEFLSSGASPIRQGYIGFSSTSSSIDTGTIPYIAGTHAFSGNVTVNSNSVLTSASTYSGTLTSGQVTTALGYTPYNSTNPSGYISGNQSISISGDASGSGTTAITLTLANVATAGTYKSVTVNAKGLVTAGTARETPTVQSSASPATITPNANQDDLVEATALTAGVTIANHTGTPSNGQKLLVRLKDNGTTRTIGWGTNYQAGGATLPLNTTAGKWHTIGLIYNSNIPAWQCVAAVVQA